MWQGAKSDRLERQIEKREPVDSKTSRILIELAQHFIVVSVCRVWSGKVSKKRKEVQLWQTTLVSRTT